MPPPFCWRSKACPLTPSLLRFSRRHSATAKGGERCGLRIQADLLSQGSEARVRAHPGKFWIQDNNGETRIALRKHFFQIFECVLFVAQAGVALRQPSVCDRAWR